MDPADRNAALATAFVEELARCGLRHAVVSPGSRSTPLALALRRCPGIDVSVIVDERSAAFFALGAAQATRTPVAMLCTSGTAAANFHPVICEADESGVPLIALTADRPPELRGIGAGQTIDQLKLYGGAVRWFCEVGSHEADPEGILQYRATACRAFAVAGGDPRPGPVHLNLAWRDPLTPSAAAPRPDPGGGPPLTALAHGPEAPAAAALDEVAARIRAASSGLILAGRQTDAGLREPLAALARESGFPILAEPTSQLRLGPHDRSHVVSSYDLLLRDAGFRERMRPDFVLRFGDMPTSKALRIWLTEGAPETVVIAPSGGWNEPTRQAGTILRADPTAAARGLVGRCDAEAASPSPWLEAERLARKALEHHLAALERPTEPGLHFGLAAAHRDGDLVYTASSMPIRDQESFLPPSAADVLFLANRGANGIDGLVSAGIGAAHASGRPTTIVTGDLGLLHDLGGLAALRGVTTPVRIVVVDNDGGGIFRFLPQAKALDEDEFEDLFGTPRGLDPARMAALFDLPFRRLDTLAALPAALEAGSALIQVPVRRDDGAELHARLARAAASALS